MTVRDLLDFLQDADPEATVFLWAHACHRIPPSPAVTVALADIGFNGEMHRALLLTDPCSHEEYMANLAQNKAPK